MIYRFLSFAPTIVWILVWVCATSSSHGQDVASICKDALAESAWCDTTKAFGERALKLVANLTLEEKAGLFESEASGIPRLNWPSFNWWSEALHGIARLGLATSWPQVIGAAASFDEGLWWSLGNLTSTEGRGKAAGVGHTYWAPNVNIFRDPRWGRGQETPGEDPRLNARFAVQYISGMQGDHDKYLKTSACLKHLSAYSQETDREGMAAIVTEQDMNDTYLPAFEAGIRLGKASCIMCSYNAETFGYGVLGPGRQGGAIPSCANRYTMTDLARTAWGFHGYIVSDCYAVNRVLDRHHYAENVADVIHATLEAGMDLECGNTLSASKMHEVYQNSTSPDELDAHLVRLFEVQLRLGWADPPGAVPWSRWGMEVVDSPEHRRLAQRAADCSLVLLKNDNNLLPWSEEKVKNLAVVGPHAHATTAMQGNYAGTAPYLISPCLGFSAYVDVSCEAPPNCTVTSPVELCWTDRATAAVARSDAVVLALGLDSSTQEYEGHDRADLRLPRGQRQLLVLVRAAAKEAGVPLAVVLLSGSPVDLELESAHPSSEPLALLWAGYPGQAGGAAIASALFGHSNTFGRLPVTWYKTSYVSSVALDDYSMRPNKSRNYPGRTHRFFTGEPLYRFGHGLRYGHFELQLSARPVYPDNDTTQLQVQVSAVVRNSGVHRGDEVLLLFGAPPRAGLCGRPLQELLAFWRLHDLLPGEARQVSKRLLMEDFSLTDTKARRSTAFGPWRLWLGDERGAASAASVVLDLLPSLAEPADTSDCGNGTVGDRAWLEAPQQEVV